ncbi:hypothetical protein DSL72_006543 [Monilinia vaccinii-corymbosi]|uniref:RRM domain-containing protein n=1 Tax=Monilinia vaccinii-corymbosi TaxID=61207 RepID=A0A8A3PMH5_9HELO|nr:hypothetical protein DSL72_006543 [Monilinia vaccinii-corymbosi]
MSRPPPYYPIVPINIGQQGYQQPVNPVLAGRTSQSPPMSQILQSAATDPTIWQVQNHVGAPAFISTHFGRYPKRDMVADHRVTPILHSNVTAGVNAKATSLRKAYPDLIRRVKKPTYWDDLYLLWDAADIQLEGPEFLYYVMHRLGAENEQLDREFERAQITEIYEYAQAWVTKHRKKVLSSAAGSMYELFISDPSESDDFPPHCRPILSQALEAHRSSLLPGNSRNPVNAVAPNLLQSNSMPQMLHRHTPNASHARAVSDRGDRLDQFGKQMNRTNIPVATRDQPIPTRASEGSLERMFPGTPLSGVIDGLGSARGPSTSTLHGGRNFSMPLTSRTQIQSIPVNQGVNMDLPHLPQTYDRFMEVQRNMSADLGASPNRLNNHRAGNHFHDKPRPRGNSIETPRNRRNQWSASYGTHQNRFPRQSQHNMSVSMKASPPRALQPEPIYVRNPQHISGSSGDTSNQIMGNMNPVASRMDPPNDSRNHKPSSLSSINQPLDFGLMEGDPNFQKRDDSCLYRYGPPSMTRNTFGRTLYLKGPDLNMFCTHQLKDLMSTIGNVVLIKFLIRPHNNGPVFVTFDTDILAAAIEKFNGYKMPDGSFLTAGYPTDNYTRERSRSSSSYNSFHGGNHTRYVSNAGLESRAYPRSSVSQHRPSRSQSGQNQFPYPNGHHMALQNFVKSFPHTSSFQPNHSYPASYVPGQYQQSPRVVQHERGISFFHQQIPLAAMNNRTNIATTPYPRSCSVFQGDPYRVNTRLETGPVVTNTKENSPIKRKLIGDTESTPPKKDSNRNTGSKHKKSSSRRNMSTTTTPVATPKKSLSQVQLNKLAMEKCANQTSAMASPSEVTTSFTAGQVLTSEITAEPESMNLEIAKQVPMTVPVSLDAVNQVLPKLSLEVVAMKPLEPVSQLKIKNPKKNKKHKAMSKIKIEKENNIISSASTMNSPADSESTNPSHLDEDRLFSGNSTRKGSLSSSIESKSNNFLNETVSQSQVTVSQSQADKNGTAQSVEGEKTSTKSLVNEVAEFILTTNATSAPTLPNVLTVKSNHKTSKTGASTNASLGKSRSVSAKDLKRLSQSNNSDGYDSSKTPHLPVKHEHKKVRSKGKSPGDGNSEFSRSQEQPKVDLNKNKVGLLEISQEKGKPSGSFIFTKSSDWPALAPSKSPPSSIADGKPPQVPALPFRHTKAVILPALPLKMTRQS